MEIDHLLQDLNGFGASLEFNVADTDIPQIVEPSAISNSLCVQQQDKDEERRKEALAIQEQIKEKARESIREKLAKGKANADRKNRERWEREGRIAPTKKKDMEL